MIEPARQTDQLNTRSAESGESLIGSLEFAKIVDRTSVNRITEAANGILLCQMRGWRIPIPRSTANRTVLQVVFVMVALGLFMSPSWMSVMPTLGLIIAAQHLIFTRGGHGRAVDGDVTKLRSAFPDRRLVAIETDDALGELAELEDVPFEPVVIEQVEAPLLRRRQFAWGLLPAVALFAATGLLTTPLGIINLLAAAFLIGLLVHIIILRMRPTYYRITPGRLERVRSRVWRREANCEFLNTWNLRTATIWLHRGTLYIASSSRARAPAVIHCVFMAEPWEMWNTVFKAAISSHESPPLPRDRVFP